MTEREKMLSGQLYDPTDEELVALRTKVRRLCERYNSSSCEEQKLRSELLREILGKCGEDAYMEPDIRFDYGCNTFTGKNFFANFNCVILDVAPVHIGDDVMFGPNVTIATPLHPLLARERTGKGTLVNTSLFASGIWCNSIAVVSHQPQFGGERPLDPMRPADPFSQTYLCSDGRWIGVYDNDYRREIPKFAELFNLPELLEPRCASLEALADTGAIVEIEEKLNTLFLTKTSWEWREYLLANSVSCEVMRTIRDVSSDEQALANGYLVDVDFGGGLDVKMPRPPVHFSEYGIREYTPAGRLGRDTDEVFKRLGYSEREIEELRKKDAIV